MEGYAAGKVASTYDVPFINIRAISNNEISLNCSNNNTKLKDSEWFNRKITLNGVTRTMRTWPNVKSMYN